MYSQWTAGMLQSQQSHNKTSSSLLHLFCILNKLPRIRENTFFFWRLACFAMYAGFQMPILLHITEFHSFLMAEQCCIGSVCHTFFIQSSAHGIRRDFIRCFYSFLWSGHVDMSDNLSTVEVIWNTSNSVSNSLLAVVTPGERAWAEVSPPRLAWS